MGSLAIPFVLGFFRRF